MVVVILEVAVVAVAVVAIVFFAALSLNITFYLEFFPLPIST